MALNSRSSKKDAAVEFIKFTVGPEAQQLNFDEFTNFPSRQSIAKQVVAAAKGDQAVWLGQLQTTIANGKEWPKLPGFSKVCTIMYGAIEKALSNQASPTDALNQAASDSLDAMTQAGAFD
jgi:ABC-type glycerol-3-phosphate transport system substrate-binding protein